jgi:hypothetical protein
MCTIVLGMLTNSTYIFSMACFFGYLFITLLINYANIISKLKKAN